ncbi:MAG: single-stranded DNA-binding protein, partial [Nitrosopumilaceae archaeon]
MSEFETLLNKLLEQRSELTRSDIEEKIKQKKEKIGAGYLTDQGALFLIASDLGVSLSEPLKVEMGLKDLYVGAKEISLETRVLN